MTYSGGFPHPQGSEGVAHRRLDQIRHILSSSGLCKAGAGLSERVWPAAPSPTSACGFMRPLTGSRQEETRSYKAFTKEFPNLKCLCKYEKKDQRVHAQRRSKSWPGGLLGWGCTAASATGLFLQTPEVKGAGHTLGFFKLQKDLKLSLGHQKAARATAARDVSVTALVFWLRFQKQGHLIQGFSTCREWKGGEINCQGVNCWQLVSSHASHLPLNKDTAILWPSCAVGCAQACWQLQSSGPAACA